MFRWVGEGARAKLVVVRKWDEIEMSMHLSTERDPTWMVVA